MSSSSSSSIDDSKTPPPLLSKLLTTTTTSSSSSSASSSSSDLLNDLQNGTKQLQKQADDSSTPQKLYQTEYRRFYYSTSNAERKLFEQSLDVYKPIVMSEEDDNEEDEYSDNNDMPIVALVVGSAWMGHRAMVYTGTSWWNASGPKSLAQLGCVCVCIRHRGAFPLIMPTASFVYTMLLLLILAMAVLFLLVLAVVVVMDAATGTSLSAAAVVDASFLDTLLQYESLALSWSRALALFEQTAMSMFPAAIEPTTMVQVSLGLLMMAVAAWLCLVLMRHGSATFDEMLEDVAEAMVWIQNHPEHLVVENKSQQSQSDDDDVGEDSSSSTRPLLLGGYSSGGHVAASLLQRPDIWARHGLPCPQDGWLDGALFLSGVMAVRADDNQKTVNNKMSVLLTNLVQYMAFGRNTTSQNDKDDKQDESLLPSPFHNISVCAAPRIPHLLIGCAHELPFGLSWLDVFFRSSDYSRQLQAQGIPASYIELPSRMGTINHWTILASRDLKQALRQGLPWLLEQQPQQQK